MRSLILAGLLVFANTSSAESFLDKLDNWYVGGGATLVDSNYQDLSNNNVEFSALDLLVGYKHSGYLGADLRVGLGLSDEYVNTGGGAQLTELDNYVSLYWRPETVNEVAKIYGLFGFSSVSTTIGDESESASGISYGGGVGFAMFDNWYLNFEYRTLIDNDDDHFESLGFNVDRRF